MLKLDAYQGELSSLIKQAHQAGVTEMLSVSVDMSHVNDIIAIAEKYPGIYASVGVHPSEKLSPSQEPDEDALIALARHEKVVAIGETGLDYYYNDSGLEPMRERFRRHIRAAKAIGKPLIIHSRHAPEDTIRILQEENAHTIGGVMHCFTESLQMAEQAMALGFYISFSGIVTFKNAQQVAEVAKAIPMDRVLIETDAPYLAPVPHRGSMNEPKYVRHVAERMAELKNISFTDVAAQTRENFFTLFTHAHKVSA